MVLNVNQKFNVNQFMNGFGVIIAQLSQKAENVQSSKTLHQIFCPCIAGIVPCCKYLCTIVYTSLFLSSVIFIYCFPARFPGDKLLAGLSLTSNISNSAFSIFLLFLLKLLILFCSVIFETEMKVNEHRRQASPS